MVTEHSFFSSLLSLELCATNCGSSFASRQAKRPRVDDGRGQCQSSQSLSVSLLISSASACTDTEHQPPLTSQQYPPVQSWCPPNRLLGPPTRFFSFTSTFISPATVSLIITAETCPIHRHSTDLPSLPICKSPVCPYTHQLAICNALILVANGIALPAAMQMLRPLLPHQLLLRVGVRRPAPAAPFQPSH